MLCILHKMVTASTTLFSGMNFQFQAVKLVKTGRWGRKEKSWLACDFPHTPVTGWNRSKPLHAADRGLCEQAVCQQSNNTRKKAWEAGHTEIFQSFLVSFPVLLITPFQLLCGDTDRQQVLFNQTRSSFKKLYIIKFLSGWEERKKVHKESPIFIHLVKTLWKLKFNLEVQSVVQILWQMCDKAEGSLTYFVFVHILMWCISLFVKALLSWIFF